MEPKWSSSDNRRADPGAAGAAVSQGPWREEDGGEEEQPGREEEQLWLHLLPWPGGGTKATSGKSLKLLKVALFKTQFTKICFIESFRRI